MFRVGYWIFNLSLSTTNPKQGTRHTPVTCFGYYNLATIYYKNALPQKQEDIFNSQVDFVN